MTTGSSQVLLLLSAPSAAHSFGTQQELHGQKFGGVDLGLTLCTSVRTPPSLQHPYCRGLGTTWGVISYRMSLTCREKAELTYGNDLWIFYVPKVRLQESDRLKEQQQQNSSVNCFMVPFREQTLWYKGVLLLHADTHSPSIRFQHRFCSSFLLT